MSGETILIVDDEATIVEVVALYLQREGFRAIVAADGNTALALVAQQPPDLIVLDLMLPGLNGLEVARRLRASSAIPIIMLTARSEEADRVVGLELGADDYLPKPFSPRELLARIRAVLRRTQPEAVSERIHVAGVAIDLEARRAIVDGKEIELTGLEFDLLVALAKRAGRVVPRDVLLELAGRGDTVVSERTVDVHVSHLRQKLGDDPRSPKRIRTVRGVGYVLAKEGV